MFVIRKTQKITLTPPFRCKEAPINRLSDRCFCFKLIIKDAFLRSQLEPVLAGGGCVALNSRSGPSCSVAIRYQAPNPLFCLEGELLQLIVL